VEVFCDITLRLFLVTLYMQYCSVAPFDSWLTSKAGNILCESRIKCGVELLVRVKFGNKLIKFDVHVTVHRDKFL